MSLALPVHRQRVKGSRFGGSPSLSASAETRSRHAESHRQAALTCDFCRGAIARDERYRLVWESAFAGELVLAEMCCGCATKSFASRTARPDTLRLVQDVRHSAPGHRVAGFVAHGVLYLLIAVTFFLIVTLISSSAH